MSGVNLKTCCPVLYSGQSLVSDGASSCGHNSASLSSNYLNNGQGFMKLIIQQDGNLVLYYYQVNGGQPFVQAFFTPWGQPQQYVQHHHHSNGPVVPTQIYQHVKWASNTNSRGAPPFRLALLQDGQLVLHDNGGRELWRAQHRRPVAAHPVRLIVQDDGNLVLYDAQNNPLWDSGTYGRAHPN